MNKLDIRDELLLKIIKLSQNIWEERVSVHNIRKWLENFKEDDEVAKCESTHALFLLSNFMYFGIREIRELLKSTYRDKVKNPLIQDIRRKLGGSKDVDQISTAFRKEISCTRFLGMGNPSESGNHLLYFFRQENDLPKELFIHSHQIFSFLRNENSELTLKLSNKTIKRYVFIDDVCGSGTQAEEYSEEVVREIKAVDPEIEVYYITLFSTSAGLKYVKENTDFDVVDCIFELDDSFKCFSENSRYFNDDPDSPISKDFAEQFCKRYGVNLVGGEEHALGYKDGQLMMGFAHNVPDNTLPIIWSGSKEWNPILKRYNKLSSGLHIGGM